MKYTTPHYFSYELPRDWPGRQRFAKDGALYNLLMQNMKPDVTIINRILDVIARAPGCPINQVPHLLPGLTRKEIFYTVGYLRRKGLLELTAGGRGGCGVTTTLRLFN
jgi:hypothetical protein